MRHTAGPSPFRLGIVVMVCVVLGAMTTLGIAWACAAWVNASAAQSVFRSTPLTSVELMEVKARQERAAGLLNATISGANLIMPHEPQAMSGAHRTESIQRAFGHTRINRLTSNMKFDVENGSIFIGGTGSDVLRITSLPECEAIDQAGWPFRAFECSMPRASLTTKSVSMTLSSGPTVISGGITLQPDASGNWRALPYRPRWFGLIGNMLLFGAMWFGLLMTPGIMRRRGRRKRGECIACGYDLRGVASDRCPECWLPHGRQVTTENHEGARSRGEESTVEDTEVAEGGGTLKRPRRRAGVDGC